VHKYDARVIKPTIVNKMCFPAVERTDLAQVMVHSKTLLRTNSTRNHVPQTILTKFIGLIDNELP
jgi:hypothetical protein